MDQESRKRSNFTQNSDYASEPSKRGRTEYSPHCGSAAPREPLSVEELLSVPIDLIFREINQSNASRGKPLLSRTEAQCVLTVSLLAHELDALVLTCATLLRRKTVYGDMGQKLTAVDNPYLRPLIPLLHVVHTRTCDAGLARVQKELDTVLMELRQAANMLRNCSEQNWALSESLTDAMMGTSGEVVATEKRRLSDVQDELCRRIDSLCSITAISPNQSDASVLDDSALSIRDFCADVFQDETLRGPFPCTTSNAERGLNQSESPAEHVETPGPDKNEGTFYEEEDDSTPLSHRRLGYSHRDQDFASPSPGVPSPKAAKTATEPDCAANAAERHRYSASQDDLAQSIIGLSRTPPNMQQSEPSQTLLRRYSLSSAASGRNPSQHRQHGTDSSQTELETKIPSQSSQDGKENTPSQSLDFLGNSFHRDSMSLVGGDCKSTGETQNAAHVLSALAYSSTAQSEADSTSQ